MNLRPGFTTPFYSAVSKQNEFGVPELFTQRAGKWTGIYRKLDAEGKYLRDFKGVFASTIDGADFHQTNDYVYPDGKEVHLEFTGKFDNGILYMDSPSYKDFSALAWDGGGCILFDCRKTQEDKEIWFFETIVYYQENRRVRTTQEFQDGNFVGINFIQESTI